MARRDTRLAAAWHRRTGPRPLALHLAQALLAWGSGGDAAGGAAAAADERRLAAFLRGLRVYRDHPYRRDLPEPPARWRRGTTRLLDYGRPGADGAPVLAVPSLVNRAYILDHTRERSLLRHLAGLGLRPLLVDWGEPGREELGFTLSDYVVGRLEPALEAARGLAGGRPPVVLGYCMGGLLALALAERRAADVAGLALLATPWDFHAAGAPGGGPGGFLAAAGRPASRAVAALGRMPPTLLQALFAGLDPLGAARRYARLAALAGDGAAVRTFVALEDWANDGVPLAAPVAEECLLGWYGLNTPGRGRWRVGGRRVRPEAVRLPAFVAVPERDRIVPPASAVALARALPGAELHAVAAGHVSMVAGPAAPVRLWPPLAAWLRRFGAAMQK